MNLESSGFTLLLHAFNHGDPDAGAKLATLVYQELRLIARKYMQSERDNHLLQPTALVHELYLKLFGKHAMQYHDRSHFFTIAAQQMRWILVDYARRLKAARRPESKVQVSLDEILELPLLQNPDLVALDDALRDLDKLNSRSSQVVELRFFAGLTEEQVASVLGVSRETVKRDWAYAKVWLLDQLQRGSAARKLSESED